MGPLDGKETVFVRRLIPRKGYGLVAARDLIAGSSIVVEAPIMIGPPLQYCASTGTNEGAVAHLTTLLKLQLDNMEQSVQDKYLAFPNKHPRYHPVLGIYRTNAIELSGTEDGMCAIASTMNHSCVPNCRTYWLVDTKRLGDYARSPCRGIHISN